MKHYTKQGRRLNNPKHIAVALTMIIIFLIPVLASAGILRTRQDKAGTTHIAVLSVLPWEEYRENLQPVFEMTPAMALERALPNTVQVEKQVLDALAGSARFAPPTSYSAGSLGANVTNNSSWSSTNSGLASVSKETDSNLKTLMKFAKDWELARSGEASVTGNVEHHFQQGDLSAVPEGYSFEGMSPSGLAPTGVENLLTGKLDVDPILQHQVATAIYQEVNLLNLYVKNACKRDGMIPYIVRMQLSVLPKKRDLPIDVYTNINFVNSILPGDPNFEYIKQPFIVPLLVTDNLEYAITSGSVDRIRTWSLGLAAMMSGFAADSSLDRFYESIDKTLSKDPNALFTLSKANEGTVRVRLGATRIGKEYVVVPRTHNITVLVFVDKNSFTGNNKISLLVDSIIQTKKNIQLLKEKSSDLNIITGSPKSQEQQQDVDKTKPKNNELDQYKNKLAEMNNELQKLIKDMPNQTDKTTSSTAEIMVIANTDYYNAETGKILLQRSDSDAIQSAENILSKYEASGILGERDIRDLIHYSDGANFKKFVDLLLDAYYAHLIKYHTTIRARFGLEPKSVKEEEDDKKTEESTAQKLAKINKLIRKKNIEKIPLFIEYAHSVWLDIQKIREHSRSSIAVVELQKRTPQPFISKQTPLLLDDGKSKTTTALFYNRELKASKLAAILAVDSKYNFAAESVLVADDGKTLKLSFPSLAVWKLAPADEVKDKNGKVIKPKIEHLCQIEIQQWNDEVKKYLPLLKKTPCLYQKRSAETTTPPKVSFTVMTSQVTTVQGKGALRISFDTKGIAKDKIPTFEIGGADLDKVTSVTGTPIKLSSNGEWTVVGNGQAVLELGNTYPGRDILIFCKFKGKTIAGPLRINTVGPYSQKSSGLTVTTNP